MRRALLASGGPGAQRASCPSILVVCGDRAAPRIIAAVQVLRELADTTVATGHDAAERISALDPDVIVAEDWIGSGDGRSLLARATHAAATSVGILLASTPASAEPNDDGLIVLPKLVDHGTLRTVCELALDRSALRRRGRGIESRADRPSTAAAADVPCDGLERYEGVLYCSRAMRSVVQTLRELEDGDRVTVLIQGETGTGKEVVARAIHARSTRCKAPFLGVNLATICESLRESELFGHVRGAFTGAAARSGLFLAANGGCLFLDEVGDASPALQTSLLRVLEEGTITPVGGDRPRHIEVRVISATNRDLRELVREGRFRRDLLYRLNVFVVRLPPLRERIDEIVPLASYFLRRAGRDLGRELGVVADDARRVLEAHPWEGNVRELRSVMERAALRRRNGPVTATDLPFENAGDEPAGHGAAIPGVTTLREHERQLLLRTIAAADGNQSAAARILGLHESTLRFRLRRAGIVTARRAAVS